MTARKAFAELGVKDPGAHMIVSPYITNSSGDLSTIMLKRTPFYDFHVAMGAKLVDFAAGKIGRHYDYSGAAGLVTGSAGNNSKYFCSDLVIQAYQQVGDYSWANSKKVSPGDIAESHALQYAGHLIAGTRYMKPGPQDSTQQLQQGLFGP